MKTSDWLACWTLYAVSAALFAGAMLYPKEWVAFWTHHRKGWGRYHLILSSFVVPVAGIITSFALICHGLWQADPSRFRALDGSVIAGGDARPLFLRFALDKVLGVLLLDAPACYGLSFSGLVHRPDFWLASLVFSYNVLLSAGLLRVALTWLHVMRGRGAPTRLIPLARVTAALRRKRP
jgi:hypothetical protein